VDFTLAELKKLRGYFEQLDDDGSGSIGLEELEQPLISLNLCKSRAEVRQVMNKIDLDGNGTLEFDEFLALVKTAKTMKAEN
jgi:Ca2+-binding EF-hand superfamily protein